MDLKSRLRDLEQQSKSKIALITEYENTLRGLREEALIIKGRYHEVEEQLANLPKEVKDKVKKVV